MSLFVCEECEHVENTALGQFWMRSRQADPRALCSLCATGTWHGRFPRRVYDPQRDKVLWAHGKWFEF